MLAIRAASQLPFGYCEEVYLPFDLFKDYGMRSYFGGSTDSSSIAATVNLRRETEIAVILEQRLHFVLQCTKAIVAARDVKGCLAGLAFASWHALRYAAIIDIGGTTAAEVK